MANMINLNGYNIVDDVARNGVATAGTGEAYTATVPGITSLKAGANFIMIPNVASTTTAPTLNVNGLGAKTIRRRLSNSTSSTTDGQKSNWLAANKPVKVVYDGLFWVVADYVKPVADDIYGNIPIEKIELSGVSLSGVSHNAIYRGKNIQDKFENGSLYTAIDDGTFDDLYIGDYFTVTISTSYTSSETVECCLAGFNTFYNNGDTAFIENHAVIVPRNCFAKLHPMNTTNTTAGGYKGSVMYKTVLPTYASALYSVFGDHLLTRRTLITNSVNTSAASAAGAGWTGSANGWEWADTELQLMSEIQVYGANVFSSSGYDTGIDNLQLPIFRLNPNFKIANRTWYWLRNVASSTLFCHVSNGGHSDALYASYAADVRPLFCIGKPSTAGGGAGGGIPGEEDELIPGEETPL